MALDVERVKKDVHAFMTSNLSYKENTSPAVVSIPGLLSNKSGLYGHRNRNNMVTLFFQVDIRIDDSVISQSRIVYEVGSNSVCCLLAS